MSQDLLEQLVRQQAPMPRSEFTESLDRRVELGFRAPHLQPKSVDPIWPGAHALYRIVGSIRRPGIARVLVPATILAIAAVGVYTASAPSPSGPEQGRPQAAAGLGDAVNAAPRPEDYEAIPLAEDRPERLERTDATPEKDGVLHLSGGSTTTVSGAVTDYRRHILGSGVFLVVEPKQVPDVVADAVRIAEDLGGYPGSSTFDVEGDAATGSADIWVPTDRYADAMARLSKLGRVERTTQASRDVTASRADLVVEIRENRRLLSEYDRRSDGQPNPQRDAIATQLELRRQRLADLDKRIQMTLVNVRVTGEHTPAKPPERWSIAWAIDEAGDIVGTIFAALIVAVAALLLPGVIAGAAWFAWRMRRRRLRDRTLDDG